MPVDIRSLLSVNADEIKKPPLWPAGTYYGVIEKYEPTESAQKKTPGITFFIRVTNPDESIPQGDLEGIDLSKRQWKKTQYITPDSLWRFKQFLEDIGISTEGRELAACLPECIQKPVMVEIVQAAPQNGGEDLYNQLGDKITAPPSAG